MSKYTFNDSDKEKIKQAVKAAEKETCGEIVPYFVNSSDDYNEASWYLSTLFGLATLIFLGLLSFMWMLPVRLTPLEISLFSVGLMTLGFLVPIVFPVSRRFIISKETQESRVQTRAMDAFLQEKVFETEERVGILIFISRLEHKVIILGDKGINEKVEPHDWEEILQIIINGIKSGEITEGLVEAIDKSKILLLKHGFKRKSSDFNELGDGLRLEE